MQQAIKIFILEVRIKYVTRLRSIQNIYCFPFCSMKDFDVFLSTETHVKVGNFSTVMRVATNFKASLYTGRLTLSK